SVGMLVITGLYSTWAQVTIAPALATPYGLTLLGKLALFLPMLALGALNLLRHAPRLRADERAGHWLRRAVSAEALLGLAVLLVVGLLTSLEPARQVAGREGLGQRRELAFQETVERTDVALAIEPALAGDNRFVVTLRDPLGRPVTNAGEVLLELAYLDEELGETSVTAQPDGDGRYVAEDVLLSVAGEWQVGVLVRRPDAFDARAAFRFDVLAGAGPTLDAGRGYLLWGLELVLLGVLFLGVALWRGGRRRQPALTGVGVLGLAAGLALAVGGPMLLQAQEAAERNPIPPTAESVARGQALYADNCQSCHGATGEGDGPLAETLEAPPADLALHVPRHSDAELLAVISNGLPSTPMPAFGEQLSEEQMWHLINYLRSLPDE
ncbi:MAG: CopD family protein, partial [bacterium]